MIMGESLLRGQHFFLEFDESIYLFLIINRYKIID